MLFPMVLSELDHHRVHLADSSVARALLLSLLLHAVIFGTLELGYQTGFWKTTVLFFNRQRQLDTQAARRLAQLKEQQQREQEIPLVFIDVDPSQAVPEPPADARYYSALSSRAANPDTTRDTPVPKVEGNQERVPQTMEKARPQPEPLQATPPPAETPPPVVAEAKPPPAPEAKPEPTPPAPEPVRPAEPVAKPGDLAYAKPAEHERREPESKPAERPERPPAPMSRPRRLDAARRQIAGLAGEKMKQPGGVKRFALEPSFDVRATPFGAYDAAIIAAIQKRWYDLLDQREFTATYAGKVVLEFRLNSDGRVTEMKVSENGVTEILGLLCQRAVQDPAPFAPWPPDLRRLVGKEYREVRFTFYYN